jgi:hypothetical protein
MADGARWQMRVNRVMQPGGVSWRQKGVAMEAHLGDRLMPDGDHGRAGVIIGFRNADGSPPYVVKWLRDGHIALVFPGPYTQVAPCGPADSHQS